MTNDPLQERLVIVPVKLAEANAFVLRHHRHHKPAVGHRFSLGVALGGEIVGVAIAGRPVARGLDDGWTLEVTRVATDGTPNACSKLYAACWKVARAMGYRRIGTYILSEEPGTSLRAAGWRLIGTVPGRSWSCDSRPRVDTHPLQDKLRWEMATDGI